MRLGGTAYSDLVTLSLPAGAYQAVLTATPLGGGTASASASQSTRAFTIIEGTGTQQSLTAPTITAATPNSGAGSATISWSGASSGVESYSLSLFNTSTNTAANLNFFSGTTTGATITGLDEGAYEARV